MMRLAPARAAALGGALTATLTLVACGAAGPPPTIRVSLDRPLNSFTGIAALGAGLDGHGRSDIAQIYTPANLRAMRGAGLGPISYRLRTELAAEAWHWNPRGSWSDPRHSRGYWTSSDRLGPDPGTTYGYRLPRRGNTVDQANNDGYSRLDDGSAATFWKSDPYLDRRYTGQRDARHPQWVMIDLGGPRAIDAARLDWADPYATRFEIQYWAGATPPARNGAERENAVFANGVLGAWHAFDAHALRGHGGEQRLRLAARPLSVRYVRVYMTASSHTRPPGSTDPRDGLGYALREVHFGLLRGGHLEDFVRHAPSNARQSVIWVSSTDPWHRATDIDHGTAQASFQRVLASALSKRLPLLMPVALAYGTPADAAAELRYLRRLGMPLAGLELGEEPDGQLIGPEDYGALYAQFARALRAVDRRVALGGPGFATAIPDWSAWPDGHRTMSWTARLLAELRAHRALSQLGFFSFEWYPFDDVCAPTAPQLAQAPALLADLLARQRAAGLARRIPLLITEYGYSPFAAQAEMELAGALLDADIAARFLSLGGSAAYIYGLEPDSLIRESRHCATFGNLTLFQSDDQHRIEHRVASYYAMRLLAARWLARGAGRERMYATSSDAVDGSARQLVSAYAIGRADGRLALLLINKDPAHAHTVGVVLGRGARSAPLRGPLDLYQYSAREYVWHPRGANGYPSPDVSPAHTTLAADGPAQLTLPPYSLSVATTRAPAAAP